MGKFGGDQGWKKRRFFEKVFRFFLVFKVALICGKGTKNTFVNSLLHHLQVRPQAVTYHFGPPPK